MKKLVLQEDYNTDYVSNDPFETAIVIPKGSLIGIVPAKSIHKKPPKEEKTYWPKGSWEEALYLVFYQATEENKKLEYDNEYDPDTILFLEAISSCALNSALHYINAAFVEVE